MKTVELFRISQEEECIRGVICIDGVPVCVSLELPWKNNAVGKSAIPCGEYFMLPTYADATKTAGTNKAYRLLDVPGRSGILIHVANQPSELEGCIAVGLSFAQWFTTQAPAVTDSGKALKKLQGILKDEESKLIINDVRARYGAISVPKPEQAPAEEEKTPQEKAAPLPPRKVRVVRRRRAKRAAAK